jgi:RNA polymerase sigma-70 factor (ECF subfamily)
LKVFSNTDLLLDDCGAMTRFLRRIAVNHAIDTVRKRKDFFISFEDDSSMDMIDEEDNGAEYELTVEDIKAGIGKLPPIYRNIITLRLFEEMSFADIALRLDVNASTARVQYSRGILQLRTLLKKKIYEYEQ